MNVYACQLFVNISNCIVFYNQIYFCCTNPRKKKIYIHFSSSNKNCTSIKFLSFFPRSYNAFFDGIVYGVFTLYIYMYIHFYASSPIKFEKNNVKNRVTPGRNVIDTFDVHHYLIHNQFARIIC